MLLNIINYLKARIKKYLVLSIAILFGVFGFKLWVHHAKKGDQSVSSVTLQPNQKEKIIVDPVKHKITVVTKNVNGKEHTSTTYFPDRATSIVEDNNGKLSIQERKWGPECKLYTGIGGDVEGSFRAHLGIDFLYLHSFDVGAGLAFNTTEIKDTRADLNLSYNFYSHTSLALSFDNHHVIGAFLKVRF